MDIVCVITLWDLIEDGISKRLSMQEKLDKALEHLKFLNNLEKPVEPNKSTLPKYIQKRNKDIALKFQIRNPVVFYQQD